MFGENIIPDDMLDGFYDKKPLNDVSNNQIDLSNNITISNNIPVQIKYIPNNIIYGSGGDNENIIQDDIMYIIRPIDKNGNMKRFR